MQQLLGGVLCTFTTFSTLLQIYCKVSNWTFVPIMTLKPLNSARTMPKNLVGQVILYTFIVMTMPTQVKKFAFILQNRRDTMLSFIIFVLVVALFAITFLFVLLVKAERKLAKHNESFMFERKHKGGK